MVVQERSPAQTLEAKIRERTARVGVLGLGYAGLPMAVEIAQAGFSVTGFDVNPERVAVVNAGQSPVSDVEPTVVADLVTRDHLWATTDFDVLADMDTVIICVPTPLDAERRPDLRYVESATRDIAARLHKGMLVALQSTCSPGTTREVILPPLSQSGLSVGEDYFVVFAPERIDPGNARFNVKNTPKLIGGITPSCTRLAQELYSTFIDELFPVTSPEVAEMSKLVENTFRFINISFVNEVAMLCDRLGISVWEVVGAAASKPFAFMPHYPSAGVGGHCIPIVPFYLEAVAERFNLPTELIEAAGRINDYMPSFVIEKMDRILADRGKDPASARILLLGVTYKRDVADLRESAALEVLRRLESSGRTVLYHDPLIKSLNQGGRAMHSTPLSPETLRSVDCVVVLTPHSAVAYDDVVRYAPLVLDTTNFLRDVHSDTVVPL